MYRAAARAVMNCDGTRVVNGKRKCSRENLPAAGAEPPEDAVFKALADPVRRWLLDRLFAHDGQKLGELCAQVPWITRFGVMKHLRVLEEGGLVVTRRAGREKFHYLNPVPIRLMHDRWISKYAQPWAAALSDLKATLEGEEMDRPTHVYEVYIRTTPERLWQAITQPEYTRQYFFSGVLASTWEPGTPCQMSLPNGTTAFEGTVLEVDPPRRLAYSFHAMTNEDNRREQPSRVSWEIQPMGRMCKLTLVHDGFAPGERATYRWVRQGWPFILSNLKSLLETGEPLSQRLFPPVSNES
jgi:uncharacterized protein YndB with AHSA1/START domain/DNA-binding transcriptional ArsR family regulator